MPPAPDLASVDQAIHAALIRVLAARAAGTAPDPEDRIRVLARYSWWLLGLGQNWTPGPCAACRLRLPAFALLGHTLRCPHIPGVARAARAAAALRAADEQTRRLGGAPLDDGGVLPGPAPARPLPGFQTVLAHQLSAALRLLLGGTVDLRDDRRAITIDELVALKSCALPANEAEALALLDAVAAASAELRVLRSGRCPGCGAAVGPDAVCDHLAACAQHPEAQRADALEQRLAAAGVEADVLGPLVDGVHRATEDLEALLRECAWVASEFGWDGEAPYLDSWAENLFKERVTALRNRALGLAPPGTA